MPRKRDKKTGRYVRTATMWTERDWDSGYVDNKGRFRIYRPDYPRAYHEGYALRAHVVWWLHTGEVHPTGTNLHHRDKDKLNDVFANLECKDARQHTIDHLQRLHEFTCGYCGNKFYVTGRELGRRTSEGKLPKFCSLKCYHLLPRSKEHNKAIADGLRRARTEGRRK